ncbi:hypothetical protein AB5N19_07462 [Seiridium cardinale]
MLVARSPPQQKLCWLKALLSVPNKPEPAKKLVDSLQAFVQWQSILAWLKDPPASYILLATDIVGRLTNISATSAAGGFKSEYDFQLAIFQTFKSAHDGHFACRPDVFKAFGFRDTLASNIVSVSLDGMAVPKLYHLADLNGTATSPITKRVSGPDSQWNSTFPTYATPGAALTVAASLAFQGPSVTLCYDNGQEKTEESFTVSRVGAGFSGIGTGDDFYDRFCDPEAAVASTSVVTAPVPTTSTSTSPALVSPTIQGYPVPVIRDSGSDWMSGYFLNGTAVLSIENFLSQSKAAGKQRLLIDLTANGGGFVIAGYELFSQLSPDVEKFQAKNLRLADSIVNIVRIVDLIPANFTATTPAQQTAIQSLLNSAIVSNLIPGGVFKPEGAQFPTVEEILAPVSLQGDLFTAYQAKPLNETAADFSMTGTGTRASPPPAVFAPENAVLLTDGICGSTCTLV